MTPTWKRKALLVVYLFLSRLSFENGLITICSFLYRRSEPFKVFFLYFSVQPVIPQSIALVIVTSIHPEPEGSYNKFVDMPEQEENYIELVDKPEQEENYINLVILVDTLVAARG